MRWWVLLTEDYTVCMSEGARPDRARIYTFSNKPLSEHKNTPENTVIAWKLCGADSLSTGGLPGH